MSVAMRDVYAAVHALGLSGRPLCVHASLRSFGWVAGGAPTIIAGLLEAGCTLLAPTFSWDTFAVAPLPHQRLVQNGTSPGYYETLQQTLPGAARVYAPDAPDIDRADMGAIPAAVLAMPGRVRGNHPLCSFAAIGPLADELVAAQKPLHVFSPLRALAEASGSVVLMGGGLPRMTMIHLAEQLAGRNLFRRWANGSEGQPLAVEGGGLLPELRQVRADPRAHQAEHHCRSEQVGRISCSGDARPRSTGYPQRADDDALRPCRLQPLQ